MHLNVFIVIWRRKLSVLLISSSLLLFALWTWAFFESKSNHNFSVDRNVISELGKAENTKNHAYLLQKLISQANRILRYQRKQTDQPKIETGGIPIVRFLKPTRSPPSALVEEASAQTLSLVARRKKILPSVGESYLFEEERLKILENQQRIRNAAAGIFEDPNNMDDERSMLSSAERMAQYQNELQRMGVPIIAGVGPDNAHVPAERLVHLDLKGAPPKLSFLKSLLPMLKTLGATGLLIEYEDMFPYTHMLEPLAAKNAYKSHELKDFLETATLEYGLTVMPLVQTFGHLEFALKLQQFENLREISENPQSICPSNKDSMLLITQMLTQIIDFHLQLNTFTHIHIGCDEVVNLGNCRTCRQRSRNENFLGHVMSLASFIRSQWPQLQVVIWDDMLRSMTLSELKNSQIGNYVEPMIWVYFTDIYKYLQPQLWDFYSQVFSTAWVASAFKGAFGESLLIPPIQGHLENNIRWLAIIAKEGGRFNKGIKGIALTGWQRYDHFAVLCELLPIGIPSLITTLSTISKGYFATNAKENDILKVVECEFYPDSRHSGHPWLELHSTSPHSLFNTCTYPGSDAYKLALLLMDKLMEVHTYEMQVQAKSGWMSDYNVHHNFSSPLHVHALTANTPKFIKELTDIARQVHDVLYNIYDEYTIVEFIEQNIYPTIVSLHRQLENGKTLLQQRIWPQRPLPYNRQLVVLNLISKDVAEVLEQPPAKPIQHQ